MRNAGGRLVAPPPPSTYLEVVRKQPSLQASQGPLTAEGCGAINAADERKIKAATPSRLSLVRGGRPRRADGSDNEHEHKGDCGVCVVRGHASRFGRTSSGQSEFGGEGKKKTQPNKNKTRPTTLAGFADRAEALAGEICGLFMKTRRGGSRRRGKQSALRQ